MTAEELFLQKFGNKLTSNESWVIRFAEEYAQQTSIQGLIDRNYASAVRRGQINDTSNIWTFVKKMKEELEEVKSADSTWHMAQEINDLKMVCESALKYLYDNSFIDKTPKQIHLDKVEFNETRED